MVVVVGLGGEVGDPKVGLEGGVSIVIFQGSHVLIDGHEEVGEGVSLAESGEGHVEAPLRLCADGGRGGGE